MKFNLRQLLMGIFLVGILLTLLRSDGCGHRMCDISGLSFSTDGELLAVARLDARDAQTRLKAYWLNVCRTVSLLNVENGKTRQVLEQDLKQGNQGPAFGLLRPSTSLIFTRADDTLFVPEFGGGVIRLYDPRTGSTLTELSGPRPALMLALNQDEHDLAAGGYDGTVIWDLTKGQAVQVLPIEGMAFVYSPLLQYSSANDLLLTMGDNGIQQWDTSTATLSESIDPLSRYASWMAISPDGKRLAIARSEAWDVYDLVAAEQPTSQEMRGRISAACFFPNGKEIAIASESAVSNVILETQEVSWRISTGNGVSAIAVSADGDRIAVGGRNGAVTLLDANTGTLLWSRAAPGRVRPPWTWPVALGVIWILLCWRLSRPGTQKPTTIHNRTDIDHEG